VEFAELDEFIDSRLKPILGMNARLAFHCQAVEPQVLIIDEVLGAGTPLAGKCGTDEKTKQDSGITFHL